MKYLQPLPVKPEYWTEIEKKIQAIFLSTFNIPVAELLSEENVIIKNFKNSIIDALRINRIYYIDGAFYGNFNSSISRELKALGAVFNGAKRAWQLDILPPEISTTIAQMDDKFAKINHQIINILDNMNIDELIQTADLTISYDRTIDKMEMDFNKSIASISIAPQLNAETKRIIAEQWGENLNLYVKDWAENNILELRQKVVANTFRGQRAENLVQMIKDNYHVSENKAKFLARQETSMLMSKYRETRYRDIGSQKYRWSGAGDEREREDHKELNNKIFLWSDPPVVNRQTGKRAHPGEDFNCRCIAVGIID